MNNAVKNSVNGSEYLYTFLLKPSTKANKSNLRFLCKVLFKIKATLK